MPIAKHLYLLRHAKSSWDDPSLGDHERPLAPRGRRAAERLAQHFKRAGLRPQLVLCSSARRALDTLGPISAAVRLEDRTRVEAGLYGASVGQLLARLRTVDPMVASVLVVGHNPGLQDLALALAGDEAEPTEQLRDKFPTGGLVIIDVPGSWSELGPGVAIVRSVTTPRRLPD